MKKIIYISLLVIAMLFICYRLLFIFLEFGSAFMKSDADVNNTGKLFIFISPVIFLGGIWVVNYAFRISEGIKKYNNGISVLLSVYGGLVGIVLSDLVLHELYSDSESFQIMVIILVLSFLAMANLTYFGAKKHLTKSSSGR